MLKIHEDDYLLGMKIVGLIKDNNGKVAIIVRGDGNYHNIIKGDMSVDYWSEGQEYYVEGVWDDE